MANESTIYGMIDGPPVHRRERCDHNRRALAALPLDTKPDEPKILPVITQSFFAISGREDTARYQVIHFGGSYKWMEADWSDWLANFEAILCNLYWMHVVLHWEGDVGGGDYRWQASQNRIQELFGEAEVPPNSEWEFEGGPRSYDRPSSNR